MAALFMSWNLQIISQSFADAAIEPALWVRAMDILAAETGSVGSILIPIKGAFPHLPVSASVQRAMANYFHGKWHLRDERFRGFDTMMD